MQSLPFSTVPKLSFSTLVVRPQESICVLCLDSSPTLWTPILYFPTGCQTRLPVLVCGDCADSATIRELLTPVTFGAIMSQLFDLYGISGAIDVDNWTLGYVTDEPRKP